MLCEHVRQMRGILEILEVVAICDHPGLLITGQLKHEIRGEAPDITPDLFVKTFGCSCLISAFDMKVKGQGASAIVQEIAARITIFQALRF